MERTTSKAKLTLWIRMDVMKFGKRWAKRHRESISQLLSDYLLRLRKIEEGTPEITPLVKRISGVVKGKKLSRESYKKYLEKKYI